MVATQKRRVLIVGGGTAGITVAARLHKTRPSLEITILDPATKHYYQPLWTLVGGGVVPKEVTEKTEAEVIPKGVQWVGEAAVEFEPNRNQVITSSGKKIAYDFLIVAPGLQIHWNKIKGLQAAIGKGGVCSNYSYEYVEKTWEFIRTFQGGSAVFTYPNTPIKCGGAPQKIMYLAEHYFRKQGIRDKSKVIFASAAGSIFGVEKYAKTLRKIIEKRQIETRFKTNLIEVRAQTKEAIFLCEETGAEQVIPYDLLHVTPPMSAPDFIVNSPLADTAGWVDVDKSTLQHKKFPNIFSLGDASNLPTAKTGAAIRKQSPVLVKNLLSQADGKPLTAKYNGYTSCPLVTEYGKVIMAEFDYDGPDESFPFDQSKERGSMYLIKRFLLPVLYWKGMLKGRA